MTYILRPYQSESIESGLEFMLNYPKHENGILVEPVAAGKSLIAGSIAVRLVEHAKGGPVLLCQPTKELLDQNLQKVRDYGFEPAVYSASKKKREIGDLTLATIGSIWKKPELFEDFRFALIDECDLWNPKESMFNAFRETLPHLRFLGLTASPIRLYSNSFGSELRFVTRTRPRVFHHVVHYTQIQHLVENNWWAKFRYFPMSERVGFDSNKLSPNSTGAEFSAQSVQKHLFEIRFDDQVLDIVERLKQKRRNILIFTANVAQAEFIAAHVNGCAVVTGETDDDVRDAIVKGFRAGSIKVVANCGVLLTGFDHPGLECILDTQPTMSLRRQYQKVGRGARIDPTGVKTDCWVVDLVGNYERFGPIEHLRLYCEGKSKWAFWGRPNGGTETQLTNVPFGGGKSMLRCKECDSTDVFFMRHLPPPMGTGNAAMLSRPPAGREATIVVREVLVDGVKKKRWAYSKPGDKDYAAAEFVLHRTVCRGKKGT